MPSKRSIISVWYGISKSGTTGSPNFSISTLQESSFPIGTDGSMMFGIVIMIFVIFPCNSFSFSSNSERRAASFSTCALSSMASSFLPWPIKAPICLEILLRFARRSSASCWVALAFASNSITSSTNGSFCCWNLFSIFFFTISGFSLKNFKSNI